MNLAITGGGTGGHLAIAKTLGIAAKNKNLNVIFIGSTSGQDKAWFEKSDIFSHTYFLETSGVVNKKGLGILGSIFAQFKAILKAKKILKKHKIEAVICVGGFSAGGASMASIALKIPLFIHEQNAASGLLNKLLAPFAKATFSSFENPKHIKTPYPINKEIFDKFHVRKNFQTLLILGGSQGAKALNDFALKVAPKLIKNGKKIIHQCGKNDFERIKNEYKKLGLTSKITLFDFSPNLSDFMKDADIALARAGASSLWELAAIGLPTIFVPYPFAAKNHQFFNAKFLADLGLAEIILQENLNAQNFENALQKLEKNLENISQKLHEQIHPNGAEIMLEKIKESTNETSKS